MPDSRQNTRLRKSYVDTAHGQLHVRTLAASGTERHAPLLCLHPVPLSGLYFNTVMPLLNLERTVIAPDYPGYGGSDKWNGEARIEDYAGAMSGIIDFGGITPDILGFHTGCLVGVELALKRPHRVRRLLLCDVPFFTGEEQTGLREKTARPMPVTTELESISGPWRFNVESRVGDVPLPRALELLAEHLRVGADDYRGYQAAFSYDCEEAFPGLETDTVVLATDSTLREASLAAAAAIPGARLIEVPEISTAVFESGAPAIARHIIAALED